MPQLPKGSHGQIASMSTAKGFSSVPEGARGVFLQARGADVTVRMDGSDPTASIGFVLKDGAAPYPIEFGNFSLFRFFEATDAGKMEYLFVS